MVIVQYFLNLFVDKEKQFFRSPMKQPIFLLFDPELNNNKLDIKVSKPNQLSNKSVSLIDSQHHFILFEGLSNFQRNAL
jgi:hypothetical protein